MLTIPFEETVLKVLGSAVGQQFSLIYGSRTPSLKYTGQQSVVFPNELHRDLLRKISSLCKSNSRILYHRTSSNEVNRMLILQRRSTWFWAKKNINRTRTFVVLEGALIIGTFSDDGKEVRETYLLSAGNTPCGLSVPANTYHVDFPISHTSLHLEISDPVVGSESSNIELPCSELLNRSTLRSLVIRNLKLSGNPPFLQGAQK